VKTMAPLAKIGLYSLGAVFAGIVLDACFQAYLDPGLMVSMTTAIFLCQ